MSTGVLATRPVLVLGAAGQLGREFVDALGTTGATVIASARDAAHGRRAIDLRDADTLASAIVDAAPSVVINAAAYTAVDRAEEEPDAADAINARAPGVIARACRDARALLLHFSTDYVFDGRAGRANRESDPIAPINHYGLSKARGEAAVSASGAAHLVFRTSWLYTPGGSNFVTTMLRLFGEPRTVKVVDDQRGSPTCARHLARSLVALLASMTSRDALEASGVYHLAASGDTTWYGFARAIHERAEPPALATLEPTDSRSFGARAQRPECSILDCSLARERLGVALPDWLTQLEEVMSEFNALRER